MPRKIGSTVTAVIASPILGGMAAGITIALAGLGWSGLALVLSDGDALPPTVFDLERPALVLLVFLRVLLVSLAVLWVFVGYGGIFGVILGIPMMASVGLLTLVWFQTAGWSQRWVYVLAGAIGGLPAGVLVAMVLGGGPFFWGLSTLGGTLGGAYTGWFAWLIRRPDRD